MDTHTFVQRVNLPVSAEEALAWHGRPGALERLIPPWENVKIIHTTGSVADGARLEFFTHLGPFPFRWLIERRECLPARQFREFAIRGPFSYWEHLQRIEPIGPTSSALEDTIQYALPGGMAGAWLAAGYVEQQLQRVFRYRHETAMYDLSLHASYADQARMKIAVTGSSGLVGMALVPFLTAGGHQVQAIRRRGKAGGIWEETELDADAVVHLAGENISSRWTNDKKKRIYSSRVDGTRALCQMVFRQKRLPRVLVCASAIGYYGNREQELLDEKSARGEGFLAETTQAWEEAAGEILKLGIRLVLLRFGMILSPRGGALAKMLPLFQCGLGSRLGNGQQYWSWISIDDVLGAIYHALMNDVLTGPINVVAPQIVTNAKFAAILGDVLYRPVFFSAPRAALRMVFGQMADELLLSSARVMPKQLIASGYCFRYPELAPALRHLLGKGRAN